MKSDKFNYCSTDTIRASPLPFRIEYYPSDRVIDTSGEAVSKLAKKLFSLLGDEEYDLESIVLKCEGGFSRAIIKNIDKFNKNRLFTLKIEIYPDYLWLQMPKGSANIIVRNEVNSCFYNKQFLDQYGSQGDMPVYIGEGRSRGYITPDSSFIHDARESQCFPVPKGPPIRLIPNLVIEVGCPQLGTNLVNRIGSWFTIDNCLGHVVNMALAVGLTFHDRERPGHLTRIINRGRLFSIKFSLFVRAEPGRRVGTNYIEVQTIEVTIDSENVVQFVNDPQPLSEERSPEYFQDPDHNLHFPLHMLDPVGDNHNLPNISLTAEGITKTVRRVYNFHERDVAERRADGDEL